MPTLDGNIKEQGMKIATLVQAGVSRLRNVHPDHSEIARGIITVAVFVFFGKLAGAAKEMAVAYRYGLSAEVDAYLFVFNMLNWPVSVWFSVITVVLVPLATRIRCNAPTELTRFRSELFGLTVLLGLALTFLAWFGLPLLMRASWIGLTDRTVVAATSMVPAMGLLIVLGALVSLFSVWILAAGRHANTLLEGVPALVILAALLVFSTGGIAPLVWGTLAGVALHWVSLFVALMREGEIETPRFSHRSPHWPAFWQGFGVMLAGQALMSFINIIDQFFAAHLGEGAIATLSYANRILSLLLGLGATAVSRATLPVFSQMQAQGGAHLLRVTHHWVRLLFGLGLVAMVVGMWLAPWAVKMLFERGAFTAQDTAVVAEVLRYGLTQLPFYFAAIVLVSLLASQGRHRTIAAVASANLLIKVAANIGMVPWLGLGGIAFANTVMCIASATLCWFVVRNTG